MMNGQGQQQQQQQQPGTAAGTAQPRVHKQMGRPKKALDSEQRARREVANSNERRRMQCINNGFNCLREILKRHNNMEKQSKAAILHESANYIKKLETDINHFLEQNAILKNFLDTYKHKMAMNKMAQAQGLAAAGAGLAAGQCPPGPPPPPPPPPPLLIPPPRVPSATVSRPPSHMDDDSDKTEEDESYQDAYLPPKKKMRMLHQEQERAQSVASLGSASHTGSSLEDRCDKSSASMSPAASERAASVNVLHNIPETAHIMEKEILELKSLLNRERILRAGLEDRHRLILPELPSLKGTSPLHRPFEPPTCLANTSSMSMPTMPNFPNLPNMPNLPNLPTLPNLPNMPNLPNLPNMPNMPPMTNLPFPATPPGYTINPIPTFIPVPMTQHLMRPPFNYNEDQPLNLKKGNEPPPPPTTTVNYHSPPATRPNERVTTLLEEHIRDKDLNFRRFLHQSISSMNMNMAPNGTGPRPAFPLPMHFPDPKNFRPGMSQTPGPSPSTSRTQSGATTGSIRDNLDLIVRAIRHIEGDEVFKNGRNGESDPRAAYMKHFAQNMDLNSSQVFQRNQLLLKRLLTNRSVPPSSTVSQPPANT